MPVAADSEVAEDECIVDADADADADADGAEAASATGLEPRSTHRRAATFGLAVAVALAVMVGWFGVRVHHSQQVQAQRSQFLQVARQGALNLTTIDWQRADADVHRILDGATGDFYNDFAKRAQPFIEVLKQAKATTVGTITEAAMESQARDTAQALVAVSVQTSTAGEPDQAPRAWRMRVSVQRVGDQVKVSNVGFVS